MTAKLQALAMRQVAVLCLAFVANLPIPARSAPIPTFEVQCEKQGERLRGSGFVVRDWFLEGEDQMVLATAFHVVNRCDALRLVKLECSLQSKAPQLVWRADPGTSVYTWPQYDLAAIAIPDEISFLADSGRSPGSLGVDSTLPEISSSVEILGASSFVGCPRAGGNHVIAFTTAKAHAEEISRSVPGSNPKWIQGSMADSVPLILYHSPAHNVSSGAAIVQDYESGVVIGFHVAGYDGWPVGWAVLFTNLVQGHLEDPPGTSHLGKADWPEFIEPKFRQSGFLSLPNEIRDRARRHQQQQVETFQKVSDLMSGFLSKAREVVVRYDRHVSKVIDIPQASEQIVEAVTAYNPVRDELFENTDGYRIRIRAYWNPEAAEAFMKLVRDAQSIHVSDSDALGNGEGIYSLNEEVNERINPILAGKVWGEEERRALKEAEESVLRVLQYAEPRLDQLASELTPFLAQLESGITLVPDEDSNVLSP